MSITRTIPDIRTIQLAESMRSSLEYEHGGTFPLWVPSLSAHGSSDEFTLHVRTDAHESIDLKVKQDYAADKPAVTYVGHQKN